MRPHRTLTALALAGAVALAGACAGGDDEATTAPTTATAPAPAPTPPPESENRGGVVKVINGDDESPLEGVAVRARVPGGEPVTVATDARGVARVPDTATVVAAARPDWGTVRGELDKNRAVLRLYDPALQSPEYGGNAQRTRFVPAVKIAPPRGEADWVFDAITLIEFPPAVVNGVAYFGVNSGRVFALDARTGRVIWEDRLGDHVASAPAVHDGVVYFTSMDGMLTAFATEDGEKLWEFSTNGSPIESSPLVHDGKVYFGAWNGTFYAVSTGGPRLVWSAQMSDDVKASGALSAQNTIVIGDYAGTVAAFDADSGAEAWRTSAGQRFYGGPAIAGNTAVIGDVGGGVIALDTRTGNRIWRHDTGGAWVYGSPAIARNTVFIGSYSGRFQALNLANGNVRWSHDAGGRISGSATVVGNVVYTSILYNEGQPRKTWGLDVRNGAVRFESEEGRYSPAVGAGNTLFLVGTKLLYAHRG